MNPEFHTKRLHLRPFRESDAHHLLDLDSDPEVMRFINNGKTSSEDDIKSHVQKMLNTQRDHPGYDYWMAFSKDTKEFMGWFLFRPLRNLFEGIEIGYRLKKKFWGSGYASEGSQRILTYAFHDLKLPKVFGITQPDHVKSQAVLKKMGMRFIDLKLYQTMPGDKVPVHYFECTAAEFTIATTPGVDSKKKPPQG